MPLSEQAAAGLRAAVEWNPYAARHFLHMLRDLPIGVRYKEQDRYGPLALMIQVLPRMKWITKTVSIPLPQEAFPEDKLPLCEVFNREWLERRFTKSELADAIESILANIEQIPEIEQVDAKAELIFRPKGTFLYTPGDNIDPLKKV